MEELAKSKPTPTFRFLSLPLEVRRKVYLLMSMWPSRYHHAVLQVSKQIYAESKESFEQRPMKCSTRDDLIHKIMSYTPVALNNIHTLLVAFERYEDSVEMASLLASLAGEPPYATDKRIPKISNALPFVLVVYPTLRI
jgi:hypothetical protein